MKYIEYGWEELEVLTKASVPIMKQDTTDVLFGFAHMNAGCDMMGSYGGFSFRLYKNGLIIVQEYLFDGILAEERRYCVPQTCADEIKQYYSENQNTIFFLNAPDNHSCDGSFSEFFFGNAWISALNIEYNDEKIYKRVKKVHPDDFDFWAEIMQAENDIMNTFFAICDILKRYDVILEQFCVTVKGVSTTTYSDFIKTSHKKYRK
jgi:hypothetical protein